MQQWLLARPEFREFLPTRTMVAYPEAWMDRVDSMKKLQGWVDVSVRSFRDLAVTGEPILLSIRFGNWSNVPGTRTRRATGLDPGARRSSGTSRVTTRPQASTCHPSWSGRARRRGRRRAPATSSRRC